MRPKEVGTQGAARIWAFVFFCEERGDGVTGQMATSRTSIYMLVIVLGGVNIKEITGGIMEGCCILREDSFIWTEM